MIAAKLHPVVYQTAEVTAGTTLVGSIIGLLPHFATALAVIWYSIMIYDRMRHGPAEQHGKPRNDDTSPHHHAHGSGQDNQDGGGRGEG